MSDIIQLRRSFSYDWVTCNPTLADGEFGFEIDTAKFKIGDGVNAWVDLPYWVTQGGTGIQGDTGIQGYTGVRGIQNFTEFDTTQYPSFLPAELGWSQRDEALFLGVTGMQWIQLGVGFKSMAGETGIQGVTGLALGTTGIAGVQGPTGPGAGQQGGTGVGGPTGVQGFQGVTGMALGSTGVAGPTGVLGVDGVTGPAGLQGVTGFRGVTGLQGVTGLRGVTGLQGTQGVTGFYGKTGVQGVTGFQGATGLGLPGSTGIAGPGVMGFILRGGYTGIISGIKGELMVPFDTTFNSWTLTADLVGYAWVQLYDASYAGFPGVVCMNQGATGLYLNNQQKNQGTMSGWSSSVVKANELLQLQMMTDSTINSLSVNLGFSRG